MTIPLMAKSKAIIVSARSTGRYYANANRRRSRSIASFSAVPLDERVFLAIRQPMFGRFRRHPSASGLVGTFRLQMTPSERGKAGETVNIVLSILVRDRFKYTLPEFSRRAFEAIATVLSGVRN